MTFAWKHFKYGKGIYADAKAASGKRASIIEIKKATKKAEAIYTMHIYNTDIQVKGTIDEIITVLENN